MRKCFGLFIIIKKALLGIFHGVITWIGALLLIRFFKHLLKAYCGVRTLLYFVGFSALSMRYIATFKLCGAFLEKIHKVYTESQSQY